MHPKFSICIPIRNEAKWLGGAIDSVLAQTDGDFELIIGDNASDDGIEEVVAGYDDPRLVHHRFENLVPVNESFNRTVALARGEWVITLSADDRMRPRCTEVLAGAIGTYADDHPSMVCGMVRRVDPEGRPDDLGTGDLDPDRPVPYRHFTPGLNDARSWLMANAAPGLSPWMFGSVALRRQYLAESGFYRIDMELCADFELAMRLAVYGPVVWIPEELLDYTVRGASATSGYVTRDLERNRPTTMNERCWQAVLTLHEERREVDAEERAAIHAAIARQLLQRALWHRTNPSGKGRLASLRDAARAARYSPSTLASPVRLGVLVGSLLAPKVVLDKSREIGHRRGVILP